MATFSFFARCRTTKMCSLIGFLLICFGCEAPGKEGTELKEKEFVHNIQYAITDFSVKHKTDTIDFTKINTFLWDSLYVFNGNYTRSSLDEGWGWINWDAALQEGYLMPEHTNRFVFIKGTVAVKYMDLSNEFVRGMHYFRYFKDKEGHLKPYKSVIIGPHFMPSNCFARKDSKFILVYPLDILKADSTELVYAKAEYFLNKKLFPKQDIKNRRFYMHSISGCGLPNCLANSMGVNK